MATMGSGNAAGCVNDRDEQGADQQESEQEARREVGDDAREPAHRVAAVADAGPARELLAAPALSRLVLQELAHALAPADLGADCVPEADWLEEGLAEAIASRSGAA